MPNYIKNRLEILGSKEQVEEIFKRFSTHYETTPRKAHDGRLIYLTEDGRVGWHDQKTGEFEGRDKEKIDHIPADFKQDFNEAWTRFPDFEKIIPMPESLRIESGSQGDMGYSIMTGNSENMFMGMQEQLARFYEKSIDIRIAIMEMGIKYAKNVRDHGFTTWYDWSIEKWGVKWNSSECEKVSDNVFEFETAWAGVPDLIEKMSLEFPDLKIIYEWSDEDTGSNCGTVIYLNGELSRSIPENGSKEAYELAFKLRPDYMEYYELVDGEYIYKDED